MRLFVVGLDYKTAPVGVRERLAVPAGRIRCCGCRLKVAGRLEEVVIVSTCNRVEIYGVTCGALPDWERLLEELGGGNQSVHGYVVWKEGVEAVSHLYSVASGLESMVLGETEITGQVKQAYLAAQEGRLTGGVTNRWFQTALQTAKELRTRTGIGRGATSVGSVAVELAGRIFDRDLGGKTVLIIGAGKMGESCVRHLGKQGARSLLVANRSIERARALAESFGGHAVAFERVLEAMVGADIVVSSTGAPQAILSREQVAGVMAARRNRPLFLIDIAVPRDIETEVEALDNVYLYNVDHLETIVRENVRLRGQELALCRQIIRERAEALMARFEKPRRREVEFRRESRPARTLVGSVFVGNAVSG